jgi:hypothetical protein
LIQRIGKEVYPMVDYSRFIAPERRSVHTPADLVENGRAHFGTFDKEFERMSMLSCRHPTQAPDLAKRLKLTLWEAVEIHLKDVILLSAVSDMGVFGVCVNVLWDKKNNTESHWVKKVKSNKDASKSAVRIAPNLLQGHITSGEAEETRIRFLNSFEKGEAILEDFQTSPELGDLKARFTLKKLAEPSIVSIPFGKNRPLCTEKAFFKATGKLEVGGKVYVTDDDSVAIIDDHRAYYPRRMHYDWLTYLGRGKDGKFLAINLTENQSTDPRKHNENLIWREAGNSLLPPVKFSHSAPTASFQNPKDTPTVMTCHDQHDMVNLKMTFSAVYKDYERHGLGFVKVDYYIVFGYIEGYVRDEAGNLIDLTGLPVIGEDKSLLL